jgi:hypothetical protein
LRYIPADQLFPAVSFATPASQHVPPSEAMDLKNRDFHFVQILQKHKKLELGLKLISSLEYILD